MIVAMCAECAGFMNPIGGYAVVAYRSSKSRAGTIARIDETRREQARTIKRQVNMPVGHVFDVDVMATAMAIGPAGLVGGIARLQLA